MRRHLAALLLAALAAVSAGCGDDAREVYTQARTAAEAKDFEAFAGALTDRSASLLRGLAAAEDGSRGRYRFLEDPYKVLPMGDVQAEEERGNLTILKVGKSERDTQDVILLRERDGWRIDVLDSPRFWDPLVTKKR